MRGQATPRIVRYGAVVASLAVVGVACAWLPGAAAAKDDAPPVSCIAIGDFDADGIPDVAASLPATKTGKYKEAGEVRVYSGKTGALLGALGGTQDDEGLASALAALGDCDGDGATDLAVGSAWHRPAVIYILSGRTLKQISSIPGGAAIALGEDLLAIGDGSGTRRVALLVRDGVSMKRYWMTPEGGLGRRDEESHTLLSEAFWVGDIVGDGAPDFVISDWSEGSAAHVMAGSIRAFSGRRMGEPQRDGESELLWKRKGTEAREHLGFLCGPASDWNGDGKGDVLTASPGDERPTPHGWRVRVLSGADGETLWDHSGPADDPSVGGVVLVPDVDGDGKDDIALGHPARNKDSGAIEVISGADGAVLWTVAGERGELVGDDLYACADADGDGRPDLVAVSPGAKLKGKRGNGYIRIVSSKDGATITLINPLSRK